jgi:hypothetical protein
MAIQGFYNSTDADEVAHGELVGPDGVVRVVVRRYAMPPFQFFGDKSPIKFVPLGDLGDGEFDLAIYMPGYLFDTIPGDVLQQGLETLIHIGGATLHDQGPDAVSRLG